MVSPHSPVQRKMLMGKILQAYVTSGTHLMGLTPPSCNQVKTCQTYYIKPLRFRPAFPPFFPMQYKRDPE